MKKLCCAALAILGPMLSAATILQADEAQQRTIRVGMIGLDTSHVVGFMGPLRAADWPTDLPKLEVVAAFPGGSPTFPLSRDRVKGFTEQLAGMGVEIVDSIDALLPKVDAILLEAVDGSQHWEYARPVLAARKPVFIDKPLAASLEDAVSIQLLAEHYKTPWFTASFSRTMPAFREPRYSGTVGNVLGCDAYGPSQAVENHPGLFWYGVHGVDLLLTVMGPGCQTVSAERTNLTESVRGIWSAGRVGTYRTIRTGTGAAGYGATVFGSKSIAHIKQDATYVPLLHMIARFFETGQSPADPDEMVEVIAYMSAAEASIAAGGKPIVVAELLEAARQAAKTRLP
jgi:predicted dehydrogenase